LIHRQETRLPDPARLAVPQWYAAPRPCLWGGL